ncbi:MAG: hypothetical protein PVF73_05325 [Bacteroidales bacterium]|jgi:opacity protein-like surface antigen
MRMIKRVLICICVVGIPSVGSAQSLVLGVKLGIGGTTYKKQSDGTESESYFSSKEALSVEFSPYFSKFYIVSGIDFETNSRENHLTIPLCLKVVIGKDFRFFLEGGGYYSFGLRSKTEEFQIKNDMGIRAGAGIQYKLNRNLILEAAYSGKFGFTPLMEEEVSLPGNQVKLEKYTINTHQFELGIKYSF